MKRIQRTLIIVGLVTVFTLVSGTQSADAADDTRLSLRVESEPAGATVYVDGRNAGETPLTLSTIAAGVHRIRLVRNGYLENSRLVTVKPGTPAAVRAQLTASAAQLKIVVVEGEGAVNIIQQKTAVAPVIEVRDRNDQPVSGAVVRFAIQKGRATFNGARSLSVTTDALGRAVATGLTPVGNGPLQIGASAAFQGQTAAITIVQTNVLTAAQASAAAAGGGAAGGGGGLSNLAIAGIVGGAGAGIGGALIAKKSSSDSDSDACAASPVCGQWNVVFSPSPPGLIVTACSPGITFSSQGMQVDASGTFHEVWSTLTPVVQVDGTLTPAGLSATLRCLSTPATGTISASPSGPDYLGTATLSGITVSIRVTKSSS